MKKNFVLNGVLAGIVVLLGANLLFNACKKEDFKDGITTTAFVPTLDGVVFEDGRLKFASTESFDNAISTLRNYKQSLPAFEKQFRGFVSARTHYFKDVEVGNLNPENLPIYMEKVEIEGETYVKPSVDFQDLGHLVNADGVYQIGNDVFKVTYWKIYKTSQQNAAILTNSSNLDNDPLVVVLPIERSGTNLAVQERVELAACKMEYDEGSRRFYCEIKSRIYPGYSRLSVDMDHYRKRFGIWWLNDAPFMTFNGTINGGCCFSTPTSTCRDGCCPTTGSNPCTLSGNCEFGTTCIYRVGASGANQSEIFDVLFENNSGSHFSISTPSSVLFTGTGDDNVVRTCTAGL